MNKTSEPKRSAASWLLELADGRKGEYALSMLAALLGVGCSLVPYFLIIQIIGALVNGTVIGLFNRTLEKHFEFRDLLPWRGFYEK